MAQIIQIPTTFEFRSSKVVWEEACASVVGWRDHQNERKDSLQLVAELTDSSGKKKTIGLPLKRLPEKERERCLGTLGKQHADGAVMEICSGLELRYFVNNSKTYVSDLDVRKHSKPEDAWQMRDDFLTLKSDSNSALAILNRWGRWKQLRNYVDMSEIIALQRAVREALTLSSESWFRSLYASPPKANSRSAQFPYFLILTDACEEAICTTTTIDLLKQLKFKACARPDCLKPFPVTSKHERNYCTQYCAHLESVRRTRKPARSHRSG